MMITFSVNYSFEELNASSFKALENANFSNDNTRRWLSEAFVKDLEGKTHDTINLQAYAYTCSVNEEKRMGKRDLSILNNSDFEAGYKGVSEAVFFTKDTIDKVVFELDYDFDFNRLVVEFGHLQDEFFIYEGVDIRKVLIVALTGSEYMIKKLKGLVEEHNLFDFIQEFLSNPKVMEYLQINYSQHGSYQTVQEPDLESFSFSRQ
ncbi:hypothetical protein [Salipaludibacillus sp. CF4.18]|uniref:hypothetical protein n=1 Tax=Salipaludibacillus sp. CF4.18 TaxID=3373081 RepID=UPI003EE536A9